MPFSSLLRIRFLIGVLLVALGAAGAFGLSGASASAQSCAGLEQQAEDGALFGAMTDGGGYIHVPDRGTSIRGYDPSGPRSEHCVRVVAGGTYRIDARVSVPRSKANSFWVTMDGGSASLWDLPLRSSGVIDSVSHRGGQNPVLFRLDIGDHVLRFHQREDGAQIDSFALIPVDLDATPTARRPRRQPRYRRRPRFRRPSRPRRRPRYRPQIRPRRRSQSRRRFRG